MLEPKSARSVRTAVEAQPDMNIEVGDFQPEVLDTEGNLLSVPGSGASSKVWTNRFYDEYKAEEKIRTEDGGVDAESSIEDIVAHEVKQSLASSNQNPAKHMKANDKLQKKFDDQDWS